jgi:hypothetical protein
MEAAAQLHLFVGFLATTPVERCGRRPRAASRINRILVVVREFYRWAAAEREPPETVLGHLFEQWTLTLGAGWAQRSAIVAGSRGGLGRRMRPRLRR